MFLYIFSKNLFASVHVRRVYAQQKYNKKNKSNLPDSEMEAIKYGFSPYNNLQSVVVTTDAVKMVP